MSRNIRDINQLSLPLWERTTSASLSRLEAGQTRIESAVNRMEANMTLMMCTLKVHSAALDLAVPDELKASPSKLAAARELLERADRKAS